MSTSPQQFPTSNGQLVPVDPANPIQDVQREKIERRRNYPSLLKYLLKTCETIESLDRRDRTRVLEAQVKSQAYYDGRQDGEVRNGVWYDNPYIANEIIPKSNDYKDHVDKLLMEFTRINPEWQVEAVDKSNIGLREAADFLAHRLKVNRERILTEDFLQAEKMSLLLKTITFRYSFFDPKAEGEGPEYKPEIKQGESGQPMRVTVCRTCGMPQKMGLEPMDGEVPEESGEDESLRHEVVAQETEAHETAAATPCERCGDTTSRTIQVDSGGGLNLSYQELPGGAVVTRRPDATSIQLDMNARDIPSSSFLRWRLSLRRCEWEAMFPGRRIPKPGERSDSTSYRDDLQGSASNDSYDSWNWDSKAETVNGGEQFEKIDGDLIWLDPVVYGDYQDNKPVPLPNGKELPANTPIKSIYAEGCCIIKIGQSILDLYPSNKNKVWSMCVYGLREHALHGAGTNAVRETSDLVNDLNAYIQSSNLHNSAPREFLRSGSISGDQLPTVNTVGIINNLENDKDIIPFAYAKAPPSPLSPDVFAFREAMRGAMQEHAGTSSLSLQGAADLKVLGTATGVEASRDQAVGRLIPNIKLDLGMEREWCYQVAELEHDNCTPEKFLRQAGKGEKGEVAFTARGVKVFFQSNVRRDFRIFASEGSSTPQTPQQDRANAMAMAQISAQVTDPEMLSILAKMNGIDYDVNEWGASERAASMRLAEYTRVAEVITKGGYPPSDQMVEVVLSQVPSWARVDDEMDNHEAYRDFYTDWWVSDEGLSATDLLRMTVRRVHELHGQGIIRQQQISAEGKIEASLPDAVAAKAQADIQSEQETAQAQDAAEMQLAHTQAQQQLEGQGARQKLQMKVADKAIDQHDREHKLATRVAERQMRGAE